MTTSDTAELLIDRLRRQRPAIPVTLGLMAANAAVFAAMLVAGAGLWHSDNGIQLAWGANFGPATQDGQWWRLGAAMFLHFSLLHVAMNLWALWDSGRLAERIYGPVRFAVIYFASGLMGNLVSLVAHAGDAVSGGASGAIFGIFGALLAYLWRRQALSARGEFRWLFLAIAGFTAASIAFGLLVPGIDNAAHGGGLVAGILTGIVLLPAEAPSSPRLPALAAALLAAGVAALVALAPPPKYRWSEERRAQGEIRSFLDADARITSRWQALLEEGRQGRLSFEELAGRVEADVEAGYAKSFERLSALHLGEAAPSAATLETLRHYAELRRDASRALAEGLRARDAEQVRESLEMAREAPELAKERRPAAD